MPKPQDDIIKGLRVAELEVRVDPKVEDGVMLVSEKEARRLSQMVSSAITKKQAELNAKKDDTQEEGN